MIEVELCEPGIFIYRWNQQVTMEQAEIASQELLERNQKQPFVALVDLGNMENMPRDFGKMRALIKREVKEGLQGYIIFNASRIVGNLVKTLSLIAPTQYLFAQDYDEALEKAREIIQAV